MSALWTGAAVFVGLFIVALFALGQRLAPTWLTPVHRALAIPAALLTATTLLILGVAPGFEAVLQLLDPYDKVGVVGLARVGPGAAVTLLTLTLAVFILYYLVARLVFAATRPRRPERTPVPAWMGWLGIAPDGTSAHAVRRPLLGSALLVFVALLLATTLTPADSPPTSGWAAATVALLGWVIALAPSQPAHSAQTSLALDPATPDTRHTTDELLAWHQALGSPKLISREPTTLPRVDSEGLWPHQREALDRDPSTLAAPLAIGGPPGSGKRTAALLVAAELAATHGRRILWVGTTPTAELARRLAVLRPDEVSLIDIQTLAPTPATLDAATRWDDPPAAIVIECDLARSSVALARLRYAVHRLAGSRHRVPVIVVGALGRDSLMTATRAIAAAEPSFIEATSAPTAAIERYLIDRPTPPTPAPEGTALLSVDAPRPHPRYPSSLVSRPVHEFIRLPGGPRGRRVRAWLDGTDPAHPADLAARQRLVIVLPGDREVPEPRLRSARHALHRSLADGWQDERRLVEVFSRRLVAAELLALTDKGLERRQPFGMSQVRCPTLATSAADPTSNLHLSEPRGGYTLVLPRESAELDAFEGAIFGTFEVTLGVDGERLLVPTQSVRSTPIRRLRFSPSSSISNVETISHHRFLGDVALEVRTTRLSLSAVHHGVRRFESSEQRAHTTLMHAPRMVAPRTVEAVTLAFPNATEAGLHALTHAVAEMLPWVVDNASDLGVSHEGEGPKACLVLWDRNPDGLGAVHDLRGADLLALLTEAHRLLATCTCQAHCASCCESAGCTTPEAPLDRHAALQLIEPLLTKGDTSSQPYRLRSTG